MGQSCCRSRSAIGIISAACIILVFGTAVAVHAFVLHSVHNMHCGTWYVPAWLPLLGVRVCCCNNRYVVLPGCCLVGLACSYHASS
jgi:hypothetical protein